MVSARGEDDGTVLIGRPGIVHEDATVPISGVRIVHDEATVLVSRRGIDYTGAAGWGQADLPEVDKRLVALVDQSRVIGGHGAAADRVAVMSLVEFPAYATVSASAPATSCRYGWRRG